MKKVDERNITPIKLAQGLIFTQHCNHCGRDNGTRIVNDEIPSPPPKPGKCVYCKSRDTEWRYLGKTKQNGM